MSALITNLPSTLRRGGAFLIICVLALAMAGCGTRYSVASNPVRISNTKPISRVPVMIQSITDDGEALPRVSGSSFASALGQALRDTEAFSAVAMPGDPVPAGARLVAVRSTAVMDNRSGSNMGKGMLVMLSLGLAAPFVEQSFGQTLSTEAIVGQGTARTRTTGEMYCGAFLGQTSRRPGGGRPLHRCPGCHAPVAPVRVGQRLQVERSDDRRGHGIGLQMPPWPLPRQRGIARHPVSQGLGAQRQPGLEAGLHAGEDPADEPFALMVGHGSPQITGGLAIQRRAELPAVTIR